MSSGAGRLTKGRKITIETYIKSKIHAMCVKKKSTDYLYVIWVKMSDLQKILAHQNLIHVAMKKINS